MQNSAAIALIVLFGVWVNSKHYWCLLGWATRCKKCSMVVFTGLPLVFPLALLTRRHL